MVTGCLFLKIVLLLHHRPHRGSMEPSCWTLEEGDRQTRIVYFYSRSLVHLNPLFEDEAHNPSVRYLEAEFALVLSTDMEARRHGLKPISGVRARYTRTQWQNRRLCLAAASGMENT